MTETLNDSETYAIIGVAVEVHKVLGCGFLEIVYQQAMAKELTERKIPFVKEQQFSVSYKGEILDCHYQADFVCYDDIVVELKALDTLTGKHESQLLNCLKATGYKRGLLINFGQSSLQYKRRVL
ncbi:MAG: GxxExxY protein [Deltaproteobacteria bacterium]|nr:GxxExxY protein [Deltaproteobacteria bacterium]